MLITVQKIITSDAKKLATTVSDRKKKRNATLRQAKTGKHECRNITSTYKTKYSGKILIY